MLLTLKAAPGEESLTAVHDAGATLVLSDEILQLASVSFAADSKKQLTDSNTAETELAASDLFVNSAHHLLLPVNAGCSSLPGEFFEQAALLACRAASSCQLTAAPPARTGLQKFLVWIQTLLSNVIAACFLVRPFCLAWSSLEGHKKSPGQRQTLYIGQCMLAFQRAFQQQMQKGSLGYLTDITFKLAAQVLGVRSLSHSVVSHRQGDTSNLSQLRKTTMTRYASNIVRCRCRLHLQKKIQTSPAMAALFWMQDAFLLVAINVGCSIQLSPCCSCIAELPQCDMHADSLLAQKVFNTATVTPSCSSAHLLAGFLHCFALHAHPVKTSYASL